MGINSIEEIDFSVDENENQEKSTKQITIFSHNVNGLLSKINELYAEVDAAIFDVYMFTETNLNESVSSINLFPPTFEIYRCDRS